jgi:hypothetical protein
MIATMKKLFLILSLCVFQFSIAQIETNCDDLNLPSCCPTLADYIPIIPAWEEIGCKTDRKAAEYHFFPKILEYQGYIFREVSSCAVQNMDFKLNFDYCIPQTRQTMRVEIADYNDPFFETKQGKAFLPIKFMIFKPEAIALGSHELSPFDRKYKKSRIVSARFSPYGGASDSVSYVAFVNERYMITITLDDKPNRFKEPLDVEKFLKDYIAQINLKEAK